jgi:hypothetical protein
MESSSLVPAFFRRDVAVAKRRTPLDLPRPTHAALPRPAPVHALAAVVVGCMVARGESLSRAAIPQGDLARCKVDACRWK